MFRLNRKKQKSNRNSLIWIIFGIFSGNLGLFQFFRFVLVCFEIFCFGFYTETESFDVSIEPKQTEDQGKQFDREHILVCFGSNRIFFCLFRGTGLNVMLLVVCILLF
jgi:hypothetical protein